MVCHGSLTKWSMSMHPNSHSIMKKDCMDMNYQSLLHFVHFYHFQNMNWMLALPKSYIKILSGEEKEDKNGQSKMKTTMQDGKQDLPTPSV